MVEVGFYDKAKYPDGTPVTNVAAWNEFGTESKLGNVQSPARPFFRKSNSRMKPQVARFLRERTDPKELIVTDQMGNLLGNMLSQDVKRSIVQLKDPPNTEYTIEKKGSTNPLINIGTMKNKATYKITK